MEFKALLLKSFIFVVTLLAVIRGLMRRSKKTAKNKKRINLAEGYRHISSHYAEGASRAGGAKIISLAAHRKRVS